MENETEIPITDHKCFAELYQVLSMVMANMPNCGCGRYYKDRNRPDPSCHRHAWLYNGEIQALYVAHDHARKLIEEAER